MRRVALAVILILASCGGEDQPVETSPPATTVTTAATATTTPGTTGEDPGPAEPDSSELDEDVASTTTTLPPNAAPEFGLSQVVFGDAAFVVITNWGNAPGSLIGIWLSQRTAFQALPDVELAPAEQALIGLTGLAPSELTGMAAIINLGPSIGDINPESGEIGLHLSDAFNDPSSLVAYVAWGSGPHDRIELATAAGLWDGTTIAVVDDAPSISTGRYPATSAGDWSLDIGG